MSALWVVAVGAQIAIEFLVVFALIDALRRPVWQWKQAGRSLGIWIAALTFGLLVPTSGFFIAIAYYVFPQPALKRVDRPIGFPGTSSTVA